MKSSIPMVVVTFEIETRPGKKQELLQTLDELHPILCREVGCHQITVLQPKLHTDMITMSEKWENAKDALRHLHSASFHILSGAINVLAQSVKMTIGTELQSASVDLKNPDLRREVYLWAEKILCETEI